MSREFSSSNITHITQCGGEGHKTLLLSLKKIVDVRNILGVTGTADSGGNTGEIRKKFPHLPPFGDLRRVMEPLAPLRIQPELNVLCEYRFHESAGMLAGLKMSQVIDRGAELALSGQDYGERAVNKIFGLNKTGSPATQDDDYAKFMNYVFPEYCGELDRNCVGNLIFVAACESQNSVQGGIEVLRKILNIKGRFTTISLEPSTLVAEIGDRLVTGEDQIDDMHKHPDYNPSEEITNFYLENCISLNPAIKMLYKSAKYIYVGPGSWYGSALPSFLTKGYAELIDSSQAVFCIIINLMTSQGEGEHLRTASDHLRTLLKYAPSNVKERIAKVIMNENGIPPDIIKRYARNRQYPVIADPETCQSMLPNAKIIVEHVSRTPDGSAYIRHDQDRLAEALSK